LFLFLLLFLILLVVGNNVQGVVNCVFPKCGVTKILLTGSILMSITKLASRISVVQRSVNQSALLKTFCLGLINVNDDMGLNNRRKAVGVTSEWTNNTPTY